MKGYTFGWALKDEGWEETTEITECEAKKLAYVKNKLEPAVTATREWDHCDYKVMVNRDYRREYVVLSADGGGGRWINVSGNSLGAIFESVGENLY